MTETLPQLCKVYVLLPITTNLPSDALTTNKAHSGRLSPTRLHAKRSTSLRMRITQYTPEGPVNPTISAPTASIEQAEDALILFDIAAIFAVVTWNADCLHHRSLLAPDAGACDRGVRR